ncbi:Csu type fimbrial protein [Tsuneonella rigui]|uniref:Csu type fimbrial protein n=1 Tax=Tsuneonella rigui TaxID=1708790 RepID=UPI000F7F0089|nr:spore coat U domain-containing protein [Tsuneonella rigui]
MSAIGIAGGLMAAGTPALAGQATNTVDAKVTVVSGCSLQTSDLMFVAPNPLIGLIIDSSTNLTVKCTPNTDYSIDIDDGAQPQATNKRRMISAGGATIPYNVYFNAARTAVWGKGAGKNFAGNSGTGAAQSIPVYGRVTIAALIPAGGYKDTLTVTLNF